jgi:hypothetical protein
VRKILLLLSLAICLPWLSSPAQAATAVPTGAQLRLRQDLKQVLADRRFNYPDRWTGLKRLAARWTRWLAQHRPRRHELKAAWFDQWVKRIGLGLVILLPLILLYCSRRFLARETRLKATAANRTNPEAGLAVLLGQARRATEQADYRGAIRYFYLAALLQLRASGSLPASSTGSSSDRENLQLLRKKLGGAAPGFQAFSRLVQTFQEKWYGLKSCDRTDCQTAGQLLATIAKGGTPKNGKQEFKE